MSALLLHLVAVVLLSQDAERRLDDAAAETEHQVQSRLCEREKTRRSEEETPDFVRDVIGLTFLDVVVGQSPAVFQLLPGEDQTLLIRRNA